jgi:hypothetical protein
MIKEAYVSFETAKLLKEKGFDTHLITFYLINKEKNEGVFQTMVFSDDVVNNSSEFCYLAPTQQMAMRWLREVHNIKINVFYSNFNCYAIEYFETNTQTGVDESVFIGDGYHSYEQACEIAIKYCLENLI